LSVKEAPEYYQCGIKYSLRELICELLCYGKD